MEIIVITNCGHDRRGFDSSKFKHSLSFFRLNTYVCRSSLLTLRVSGHVMGGFSISIYTKSREVVYKCGVAARTIEGSETLRAVGAMGVRLR